MRRKIRRSCGRGVRQRLRSTRLEMIVVNYLVLIPLHAKILSTRSLPNTRIIRSRLRELSRAIQLGVTSHEEKNYPLSKDGCFATNNVRPPLELFNTGLHFQTRSTSRNSAAWEKWSQAAHVTFIYIIFYVAQSPSRS